MPKTLLAMLSMVSCLCSQGFAETARVGDVPIVFDAPDGFVRADDLYPVSLAGLDGLSDTQTILFAQFVPAGDAAACRHVPGAVPSWYIHLAHDGHLAGYSLNAFTFAMIARLVERGVAAQYDSVDFLRELEAVISGALRREFTLDFMAPRGTVDNARGIRSMLAYGFGQLETDSGPEDFHLATLTTMYLTQGKLVVILQAGRLEAEDGIAAFRQRAQGIAAEIMGKGRGK